MAQERVGGSQLGSSAAPSILVALGLLITGCASSWTYTYEDGERLARREERPLVILYKDLLDPLAGRMQETLRDPQIRKLRPDMVVSVLVSDFEPNRRYVGQYGVNGAPAMIVVHPDGTYHSHEGALSPEGVWEFLSRAVPPGEQPNVNIQIPRNVDYMWEGVFERAAERARRQNRDLLIVYKWWLSADSTELLFRLSRPQAAHLFQDTVNCLLDWDYLANRRHVARFGVTKVPAMIIVRPDGSYRSLTGLASVEQIVRFANRARSARARTDRRGTPRRGSAGRGGATTVPRRP